MALSKSTAFMVKVRSVVPDTLSFWTIISTLISDSARGSKIEASTPGLSTTEYTVILTTSFSVAMPLTRFLISPTLMFISASSWINVPGRSSKLDATKMGTPYTIPNSIDLGFIFAP